MIRILLTGGGSGGHIYPLLAVADALLQKKRLNDGSLMLSYMGPQGSYESEFEERGISIHSILGSKIRRYFSIENLFDIPKFFISLIQAVVKLYILMPDVVFSKGGPGSLPVVIAARWYFIPVLIHESDAIPGIGNRIAGKFATRIALSFEEATHYFPPDKTALVGNPIRDYLPSGHAISKSHIKENLGFDPDKPLVLILGGSQGALPVNNLIFDNFKLFLEHFQIFHQVGQVHEQNARDITAQYAKELSADRFKYRFQGYFSFELMRDALSAADIVISRAGSSAVFEIARFGIPAILIPLEGAANGHQHANAAAYANSGAALVYEEDNLKGHLIVSKIQEILSEPEKAKLLSESAFRFARADAAQKIADEVIFLASKK